MGREFLDVFEVWAENYDETVAGQTVEYADVFAGYNNILDEVVQRSLTSVLEFGVGTGNLTQKLLNAGKDVVGIEPSKPMRKIAISKLGNSVEILDGDFLEYKIDKHIDTIVSTYAFHHLTDEEKDLAFHKFSKVLQPGGKVVFADTMFVDQQSYDKMIIDAKEKGYHNLAKDLQTEYYPTIGTLATIAEKNGFNVSFTQLNRFVWIMEAIKQ